MDTESARVTAGDSLVTADVDGTTLGLTICYDLRFPELYRALALAGARILTVPANFTERTGRDHWEVLLRARAIENAAFVLAPSQIGGPPGQPAYGRSMVDRPVGHGRRPGARHGRDRPRDARPDTRRRGSPGIPVLANRRPRAYRIRADHPRLLESHYWREPLPVGGGRGGGRYRAWLCRTHDVLIAGGGRGVGRPAVRKPSSGRLRNGSMTSPPASVGRETVRPNDGQPVRRDPAPAGSSVGAPALARRARGDQRGLRAGESFRAIAAGSGGRPRPSAARSAPTVAGGAIGRSGRRPSVSVLPAAASCQARP